MYVIQFLDHATKYCWVYPMKTRDESIEKLRDLVDVQLKRFQVKIKHYHADGAAELIGKQVVQILKREGATYMEPRRDTRTECHHGAEVQNARGEDALHDSEIRTACGLLVGRL